MSAWLPLSLIVCNRTFETNVHSVDEVVVRKRVVLFIRNRFNLTRLVVVSFKPPIALIKFCPFHYTTDPNTSPSTELISSKRFNLPASF